VFDVYGDSGKNLLEFLAVVIIWSLISSARGSMDMQRTAALCISEIRRWSTYLRKSPTNLQKSHTYLRLCEEPHIWLSSTLHIRNAAKVHIPTNEPYTVHSFKKNPTYLHFWKEPITSAAALCTRALTKETSVAKTSAPQSSLYSQKSLPEPSQERDSLNRLLEPLQERDWQRDY